MATALPLPSDSPPVDPAPTTIATLSFNRPLMRPPPLQSNSRSQRGSHKSSQSRMHGSREPATIARMRLPRVLPHGTPFRTRRCDAWQSENAAIRSTNVPRSISIEPPGEPNARPQPSSAERDDGGVELRVRDSRHGSSVRYTGRRAVVAAGDAKARGCEDAEDARTYR